MIDRYIAEHLPKLAKTNAGDQVSILEKMVEPAWGNRLVTEPNILTLLTHMNSSA